ncbi:SNF1-related protein kinase regulatory subunit gamma-1 [Nymphaea thermarum]|nr:SNF1-related protein kinase regulatory subunit gamma-1 [Nymphaea thermarum]
METLERTETTTGDASSEAVKSPETKLGMTVEGLWEIQAPLLSPLEKLNSCFKIIPVSSFPPTALSQIIEINSDASLEEAVEILSKYKILSAPVRNVEADDCASWIDRYIGIVEFAGISVWLLHQSELAALDGVDESALTVDGLEGTISILCLQAFLTVDISVATEADASMVAGLGPAQLHAETMAAVGGDFFEAITSSAFYKKTKVKDIAGSFRWAPFLPLQNSDSFLTMLLLLSKYGMKILPVVDIGEGKIDNIITQSSVLHMLAESIGSPWFQSWGMKQLRELGLPVMKPNDLIKVYEDEPVLQAFKLMREKGIGGLPVVDGSGLKPLGNISIRDVQYLLTTLEIYKEFRSITAKTFLTALRTHLVEHHESSPLLLGTIACKNSDTLRDVILRLDGEKIHRIYVADEEGNLEGVITLRDIISKLVVEPPGYFGDFFGGVVPLPKNSRV